MHYVFFTIVIALINVPALAKYHVHIQNYSHQRLDINSALSKGQLSNNSYHVEQYQLAAGEKREVLWVNYNDNIKFKENYLFSIKIQDSSTHYSTTYFLTIQGDLLGSTATNIKNNFLSWDNPKEKKIMDFSSKNSPSHEIIGVSATQKTTQGIDDIDIIFTEKHPSHYQSTNQAKHLTLASYNIQVWPLYADPVNKPNHKALRTQLIPAYLHNYDIVAIEELFQNDPFNSLGKSLRDEFNTRMKQQGFNYQYGPIDTHLLSLSSGVILYSKWPITSQAQQQFTHCQQEDCLAAKGIAYMQINKYGQPYHIFATHLNALQDQTQNIQKTQIDEMSQFIEKQHIPPNEPILLMGDLNSPRRPINNHCEQLYKQNDVLHESLFVAYDYLKTQLNVAPIENEQDSLCFSAWPNYNSMNNDLVPALYDAIYLFKNPQSFSYSFKNRVYALLEPFNQKMYPNLDLSDHYLIEANLQLL